MVAIVKQCALAVIASDGKTNDVAFREHCLGVFRKAGQEDFVLSAETWVREDLIFEGPHAIAFEDRELFRCDAVDETRRALFVVAFECSCPENAAFFGAGVIGLCDDVAVDVVEVCASVVKRAGEFYGVASFSDVGLENQWELKIAFGGGDRCDALFDIGVCRDSD